MMKVAEIRGMTPEAISAEAAAKKKELFETRCKISVGDEINPMQLTVLKRDLARLKTVLREKELESASKAETVRLPRRQRKAKN